MQEHKLQFDARLGQLYKLWLVNFLLNVMTLGIFSFWGKTRVRRYVISSMKLGDDRFEYTGTGGELFKAFLMATVFFIFLSVPFFIAMWQVSEFYEDNADTYEQIQELELKIHKSAYGDKYDKMVKEKDALEEAIMVKFITDYTGTMVVIGIYLIIYFGFLPPMARYSVLIYQVGHIRWRGIRGHQEGNPFIYPFLCAFHLFLTFITLGIWKSFKDAYLIKYKLKNMQFGCQKGEPTPNFKSLFISHWLTVLIFIFTLGISRFWYRASLARTRTSDFKLGSIAFDTDMEGVDLFLLKLVNFLIIIGTLGIGYPLVLKRNLEFMATHTIIRGDLEKAMIEQAPGKMPKIGEGVSHWIDVGAKFGTGYLLVYF